MPPEDSEPKLLAEPLSELEERFCHEYAACLNATQAYLRVKPGVKLTTASTEGSRLLGKPWVSARIEELRDRLNSQAMMDATERRRVLTAIARADHLDVWEPSPYGGMRLKPLDELTPGVVAGGDRAAVYFRAQ